MAVKKTITKMACGTCKTVNYFTKKSKKLTAGTGSKLELKKFCKKCKKHTAHKEAKR